MTLLQLIHLVPPYWIEVSPTNRWKMFDTNINNTTHQQLMLPVLSITPGKVVNSAPF